MIHIPDSLLPKNEAGQSICPRCQRIVKDCVCPSKELLKFKEPSIKAHVRLEKSGRKGKVVTVIENLPRQEAYLKDLAKDLKTKTGSGGTFYFSERGGVVEIQGDHQAFIKKYVIDLT